MNDFNYASAVTTYCDPDAPFCSVFVDHVALIEAVANIDGISIKGEPELLRSIADSIYAALEG